MVYFITKTSKKRNAFALVNDGGPRYYLFDGSGSNILGKFLTLGQAKAYGRRYNKQRRRSDKIIFEMV